MKTINVIRHLRNDTEACIRPDQNMDAYIDVGISNLGGITFMFELTFPESTDHTRGPAKVRYAYALCPENVNFNRAHGTAVAKAKLEMGAGIELFQYNPAESLMYNVFIDLHVRGKINDGAFMEKKLYRLYNYMKKIGNQHNKNNAYIEQFVAQISAEARYE